MPVSKKIGFGQAGRGERKKPPRRHASRDDVAVPLLDCTNKAPPQPLLRVAKRSGALLSGTITIAECEDDGAKNKN